MNKFTSLLLVLLIVIPSFAQTQKGLLHLLMQKLKQSQVVLLIMGLW